MSDCKQKWLNVVDECARFGQQSDFADGVLWGAARIRELEDQVKNLSHERPLTEAQCRLNAFSSEATDSE